MNISGMADGAVAQANIYAIKKALNTQETLMGSLLSGMEQATQGSAGLASSALAGTSMPSVIEDNKIDAYA